MVTGFRQPSVASPIAHVNCGSMAISGAGFRYAGTGCWDDDGRERNASSAQKRDVPSVDAQRCLPSGNEQLRK